jgi:hypothetical protein
METSLELDIAKDYSAYPAGRDEADGPFNGERFRRELLLPLYQKAATQNVEFLVSLVGVKSFGSSFLEEAFGGLVRKDRVDKNDLRNRLRILPGRPGNSRYEAAIYRYINQA